MASTAGPLRTTQPVSAAAEALFETKNVAEIRQIEARTRRDIEDKTSALRQLVGDSYRDIIDGTDKIADISAACQDILGNLLTLQEGLGRVATGVSTPRVPTKADGDAVGAAVTPAGQGLGDRDNDGPARKHQELIALGTRVKYLLDTPEAIWGSLEAGQHIEAARRQLRAEQVHAALHAAHGRDVSARFPLLTHQWPFVVAARQQVLDAATAALSEHEGLSTASAADALAALAALEGHDANGALRCFLACRRQWATAHVHAAAKAGGCAASAGVALAELAAATQTVVAQVGALFCAADEAGSAVADSIPTQQGEGMLRAALREDDADASELFFPGPDAAHEGAASPEAAAWREHVGQLCARLDPPPAADIQASCSAWLHEVGAELLSCSRALLSACGSGAELLDAQRAVHSATLTWVAPRCRDAAPGSADCEQPDAPPHGTLGRSADQQSSALAVTATPTAGPFATGVVTLPPGRLGSEWEAVCGAVLGDRLDLWEALFHTPFLARARQLVTDELQSACDALARPLDAALLSAACAPPEPAGLLRPDVWPAAKAVVVAAGDGPEDHPARRVSGTLVGAAPGMTAEQSEQGDCKAFRAEAGLLQRLLDCRLHAALHEVLLLSGAAPDSVAAPGSLGSAKGARDGSSPALVAALATAGRAAGVARAAQLQAHAQECCGALLTALAAMLGERLAGLSAAPAAPGSAGDVSNVEQALLLARLASAIAEHSKMLPVLLGPPDSWPAAWQAGPHAAAVLPGRGVGSGLLPASLAQGVGALGPAAAALLRSHPGLFSTTNTAASDSDNAAQLAALRVQLRRVSCDGHARWARWAAAGLAAALLRGLQGDALLRVRTPPPAWLEVRLPAAGGAAPAAAAAAAPGVHAASAVTVAAEGGEVAFALPGTPSSAVLQLLSLACWETRRAGEHDASANALQLLQWELHGAALDALQVLTEESAALPEDTAAVGGTANSQATKQLCSISDQGVLQLLFDQRLIRDALAGGRPLEAAHGGSGSGGSGSGATATTQAERRKRVAVLEQQLQERLDPIDWATYEQHLWQHVQAFHARAAVLLGALSPPAASRPGAPPPRTGTVPGVSGCEAHALNMLPLAPRLHYLPVSTPSALHGGTDCAADRAALPPLARTFGGLAVAPVATAAAVGGGGGGGGGAAAAGRGGDGGSYTAPPGSGGVGALPADLAAAYLLPELGSAALTSSSTAAAGSPEPAGRAAAVGAAAAAGLQMSADAAAAAGASAFSALQARLQGGGLGAFGSLLGDRAAEVSSAMAQNLGDLLPSAGLGGGLLSSFARPGGPPSTGTGGS